MSFAFTNTTGAKEALGTTVLGLSSNYSVVTDDPTIARVNNATASLEQPEIITYRSNPIGKVSSSMSVRNPAPVQDGVQYTIKLETIDRRTVGTEVYDEPIVAWLTIKHPASDNWDNAKVSTIVGRLISACVKGQTSGSITSALSASNYRFEDLMRSALVPKVD